MSLVKFVDRRNSNSDKWNNFRGKYESKGLLGLWVADMDFRCPEEVISALKNYVEFGVMGYSSPSEGYNREFIKWQKKVHGIDVDESWIRFSPGVVPAINWAIKSFTKKGDGVIINSPVYYPFFDAIINNNRTLVESSLVEDNMVYSIDFNDFEEKIVSNNVKLYILCNPHNPVSRVWRKEEIQKIVEICEKHNVIIFSDEIHQDLTFNGLKNISLINYINKYKKIVVATSASKSFNLAATANSFLMIPDEDMRKIFDKFTLEIRMQSGNPMGYIAVEAAYKFGGEWLEEVKEIIYNNYLFVKDKLKDYKGIRVSELEGTYLMWIDMREATGNRDIHEILEKKCKISVDYGEWFGGEKYEGYIRLNLATSPKILEEAVESILSNF
ncbi:MalY/PatB family protein [Peptostreptococcus faecalis]|uniref:MalY/PatB family protein n=1 Tax=Peptostreptococcus faecalis TaxID=2045015 RepID=UPI000C7D78F1|nr:MalY/PatB family protein [Peptostreptococcus faecalis]